MLYTQHLELYFMVNGIATDAAEQCRAILLSVCGLATFSSYRTWFAIASY